MRKRVLGGVLGIFLLFNTLGANYIALAEEVETAISVEANEELSENENIDDVESEDDSEAETVEVNEDLTETDETELADEESSREVESLEESEDLESEEDADLEESENMESEKDLDEETEDEEDDDISPAFDVSKQVGDVLIRVKAAEGVLPENASVSVVEITDNSKISSIEDAVENQLSSDKQVTEVKAFDITIYDENGNEAQPNTSYGNVSVTFENIDTSEATSSSDVDMQVFHVNDSMNSAEGMNTSLSNNKVSFKAEHFSIYVVASIDETTDTTEITGEDLIESIVIKDGDTVITDGASISFSDTLSITYSFKDNIIISDSTEGYEETDGTDYYFIKAGQSYQLPSLDVSGLKDYTGDTVSVDLTDESTGDTTHIGDISIDSEGNVTLVVSSGIDDDTRISIGDFIINFSLDESAIGTATSYTLNLGSSSYTFTVKDNVAEDPTISTKAVDNGDDTVTWTSTITNADVPVDYSSDGYTFVGVIDENQVLDEYSIEVNGVSVSVDGTKLSVTGNDDGTTTITYVFDGDEINTEANGETTITYTTTVDFLGNGGAAESVSSRTVTNDVKIATSATASDSIATASGSGTVNASKEIASLSKSLNNTNGKFTKNETTDNGEGNWTITVNTNDYAVKNLTIYDYLVLGESSTDYTFTVDTSSIVVTKGGTKLTEGTDYTLVTTAGTNSDGNAYSWYILIDSAEAGSEFVITYTTLLSNYTQYLRTNHSTAPYNSAFMTYEYEKGSGTWVEVEGPSMKVSSTITTNAGISVSTGTSSVYDAATHQITWTVTVNKEAQELTNASIVDIIPSNQTFISSTVEDVVSGATVTVDSENSNKITFDIGDAANEATVTFEVVTQLTDDEIAFWGNNVTSKTYYNPFTLYASELDDNGLSVTASCTCKSEVIDLTAGTYNYDTHEIEYTIEVDDNLMLMSGVTVTDDLGAIGLELVEGSVELDGTEVSGTATTGVRYIYVDGVLTVYSDDVASTEVGTSDAKSVITFTAKVTDEKLLSATSNTQSVSIYNEAVLDYSAYNDTEVEESDSASTTFTNNIILKDATIDTANLSAEYVVTFNANQIELPSNVVITDALGKSMDLDISSVKLYIGTVDASTGVVTSSGTEESDYEISTAINDDGQTVLTVKLPSREGNTNAYYLTYSATAVDFDANDYGNSVSISGYTETVISATNIEAKALASVSGNYSSLPKIIITNVDAEDNNVTLAESTFVITDSDGNVVRTLVTKTNGTAKAVGGKLKNGETYTVTQTYVNEDYELVTTSYSVTISSYKGEVTVENPKKTLDVSILKQDGLDNFVENAELEITWVDSSSNTITADSWTTDDAAHTFTASYNTEYTLTEISTPFGYNTATNIVFKVEDGVLYQKETDDTATSWVEVDSITMVDVAKDTYAFTVSKVSASQLKDLIGAELIISEEDILDAAESNYIAKWTTDGSQKEFAFPEGVYYLYEVTAPYGYDVADPIQFRVTSDLVLQVYDSESDSYVDVEDSNIQMVDSYSTTTDEDGNEVSTTTATFTLSSSDLGIDSELFSALMFSVWGMDLTSAYKLDAEVTTDEDGNEVYTYELNYQEEYILRSEADVDGYDSIEPVSFTIVAEYVTDEEGNIVTDEDGNSVITTKVVVRNSDGTYTTYDDIASMLVANATPQVTPVIVEPEEEPTTTDDSSTTDDSTTTEETTEETTEAEESTSSQTSQTNGSSTVYYGTATSLSATDDDEALELRENNIVALDSTEQTGETLARTGGFIGTIMGYLFAIALIAVGVFLVFGKEKRVK